MRNRNNNQVVTIMSEKTTVFGDAHLIAGQKPASDAHDRNLPVTDCVSLRERKASGLKQVDEASNG